MESKPAQIAILELQMAREHITAQTPPMAKVLKLDRI